jgi:hypothetical protein
MSPKTKKYLWIGGGALTVFLLYNWWKGRKAHAAAIGPMPDAEVTKGRVPVGDGAGGGTSTSGPMKSLSDAIAAAVGGSKQGQVMVRVEAGQPIVGPMPAHVQRQMDAWLVMNKTRAARGLPEIPMPPASAFASGTIDIMKVGR